MTAVGRILIAIFAVARRAWLYRSLFAGALIGSAIGLLWFAVWNVEIIWGNSLFLAILSIPYDGRQIAELMRDVLGGAFFGFFSTTLFARKP